jgi:DNA-binding NarL/FixJ family response regulator
MENNMSHSSKMAISASVGMPNRGSYSEPPELSRRYPTISIVVLCGQREEMLGALQSMFGGSTVNIFAETFARDNTWPPGPDEKPAISHPPASTSDLGLTERQLDVLALMMQGNSNKAICRILKIAESTVKNHVTAILRALKVSNRTEAVLAAGGLGWKSPTTAQSH